MGEIGLLFLGILMAIIVVILKDRKKLKSYTDYLKETIKKLKKKLKDSEQSNEQERILKLLNELISYVREQYQAQYGDKIASPDEEQTNNSTPSVEKFVFIAGFQTMTAQLSALENTNEAEHTWDKIKNELSPLFTNYLESFISQNKTTDKQHIQNLEKFKQLYFELQNNLSNSIADIEQLNHQISQLAKNSDNGDSILLLTEKNNALYLEMGQMVGMDSAQHHDSVTQNMDYSEAIINERKDEIKRLKGQIAKQFEDIWTLQNRLKSDSEPASVETLSVAMEAMSRNLKDAEMCIETMDMEIQTLSSEITNLKNQRQDKTNVNIQMNNDKQHKLLAEKEAIITRMTQESKELMSCMTGLEEGNLEQNKQLNALEEKNKKLEVENATIKANYINALKNNMADDKSSTP
jgi:Sec-independent protein translocase protein TatA